MISIVLLLKIIGMICFIGGWVYMFRVVRRTERRLERLKAHFDEQLAQSALLSDDMGEAELKETRRRALEAERRFTEGIASVLNFGAGVLTPLGAPADEAAASDRVAGKKAE